MSSAAPWLGVCCSQGDGVRVGQDPRSLIGGCRERTRELERRNYELEQMNKAFVGRELRMVELKERIRELESRLTL